MRYKGYSATDFANDSFFIRWVKNPDEESNWFWESFMKENPLCVPDIEKARELITAVSFKSDHLRDDELSTIRNSLLMTVHADKEEEKDNKTGHIGTFSMPARQWLKLAASIIMIPLFSAALYVLFEKGNSPFSFDTSDKTTIEKRTDTPSEKSVVFLSDGTKVWLNSASRITYVRDFNEEDTRDVYLDGEAFFEVASDAKKPFIVHTSSIRIKVLGTSFNVKSYPREKTIETTLVHGKVRIEQSDVLGKRIGDVELKPNQLAVFNKESKVIKIKEVVASNAGAWKTERLLFNEEPIDHVILQLEKWYNVSIHVEDSGNLGCKLTATIEKESLDEVLKLMEASHNITYKIVENEVFIKGSLCSKTDPE